MTSEVNQYYVYEDWTLEEQPRCFYVGKGNSSRLRLKRRNVLHTRISKKFGHLRKIVFKTIEEQAALNHEIKLISTYKTCVYDPDYVFGANFTYGGEGISGFKCSYELKNKHRIIAKKNVTDQFRKLSSEAAKKEWADPQIVKIIKENHSKAVSTQEYSEKIRKAKLEHWKRPEYRSKFLGENNPASKLNWTMVREIRSLYNLGFKRKNLSMKFCLSYKTICRIISNESWIENDKQ